ncbi:hypothetical protein [Clostridium manihotivorum]|uniref:Uncharacterized protein n=1 Tax=Clostridium manihotivorum TaxID=2320868 RepID=A0A410DW78_9CLOT|nr:hypothetical protein [Clostridium manihotivorum]QAA33513.1 hypothetical protein C1I91_18705 [Clostridium manihotivorum]
MKKINKIWQPIFYYICTICMLVIAIFNYNKLKDQANLVLQLLLVIIFIVNSIVATVRYKKSLK